MKQIKWKKTKKEERNERQTKDKYLKIRKDIKINENKKKNEIRKDIKRSNSKMSVGKL